MAKIEVKCPYCETDKVVKYGKGKTGVQRYKCIVFQRTPEKPELNGAVIAEINGTVSAVVTALGFLQDFLSGFFVAVTC